MTLRTRLSILVALTTVAWAITLAVEGEPLSLRWLGSFGLVQAVVTGGVFAFERYLWRLPGLPRLLNRPAIHGTWAGVVQSSYENRTIPAYLAVRQTYSSISIYVLTASGRSHTLACNWQRLESGDPGLFYIYQLVTNVLDRPTDPVRYGGGILEICGRPPIELAGPYWTDARTIGVLSFKHRVKRLHTDFNRADSDFQRQ
jgi:SMODS-associating 2TM, beta-strand rich effector domain